LGEVVGREGDENDHRLTTGELLEGVKEEEGRGGRGGRGGPGAGFGEEGFKEDAEDGVGGEGVEGGGDGVVDVSETLFVGISSILLVLSDVSIIGEV